MIKTNDFIKPCSCRSAGECMHNITAEFSALDAMVDKFAAEMKKKLRRNYHAQSLPILLDVPGSQLGHVDLNSDCVSGKKRFNMKHAHTYGQ